MKKLFSYFAIKNIFENVQLWLFLCITTLLNFFPLWLTHKLGKAIGFAGYHFIKKFRKTALLNLNLAFPEKPIKEKKQIAKQSCQHIAITILELLCTKKISKQLDNRIILNPKDLPKKDIIWNRLSNQQGCIFFIGHQANWEIPFTFLSRYFPGIALAKKIKNQKIYKKIISLREKYKGRIHSPSGGIKLAKEKLLKGEFVGLVGDQSVLISDYSCLFFGKKVWTSNSAALLAYKTNTPVCNIFVKRKQLSNVFSSSELIFPNTKKPFKEETNRIMDLLMKNLETSIKEAPEQWMWIHNRWKQKINPALKKMYRFHTILIIASSEQESFHFQLISALYELYKNAEIHLATNIKFRNILNNYLDITKFHKIITYKYENELKNLLNIYQGVFNFSHFKKINRHFLKTGSLHVFSKKKLMKTENIVNLIPKQTFHEQKTLINY